MIWLVADTASQCLKHSLSGSWSLVTTLSRSTTEPSATEPARYHVDRLLSTRPPLSSPDAHAIRIVIAYEAGSPPVIGTS